MPSPKKILCGDEWWMSATVLYSKGIIVRFVTHFRYHTIILIRCPWSLLFVVCCPRSLFVVVFHQTWTEKSRQEPNWVISVLDLSNPLLTLLAKNSTMKIPSLLTCGLLAFSNLPIQGAEGSVAAGAALNALKSMDYRYFIAGGTCAAFSHGITCPIDVVKASDHHKMTSLISPAETKMLSTSKERTFNTNSWLKIETVLYFLLFFWQTRIQADPKVRNNQLLNWTQWLVGRVK